MCRSGARESASVMGMFAPRKDRLLPCSTSATAAGYKTEPKGHRGMRKQISVWMQHRP